MRRIQRTLLSGASGLAVCAVLGSSAFGQTNTTTGSSGTGATPDQKPAQVETVVVTGIRGSLRDSLTMKQSSDLITENISAKDIGQLPDITIAEELNTLPGVNASRDRGNDSQVSIRGLGPRLVLGLVNGEEIASSETRPKHIAGRFFRRKSFPASRSSRRNRRISFPAASRGS